VKDEWSVRLQVHERGQTANGLAVDRGVLTAGEVTGGGAVHENVVAGAGKFSGYPEKLN